jgi:hypothetical protein
MNAILKCADLSRGGLLDLLGQVPAEPDEPVRLWLEGVDGWSLAFWPGTDGKVPWCGAGREPLECPVRELVGGSLSGRIFAPSGELRWRVLPALGEACCRTVFLGWRDWLPGQLGERSEVLADLTHRTGEAILWGQKTSHSGDDWIELRVPHRFRYPVRPDERAGGGRVGVKAVVEEWADASGDPHFVRLCDLRTYSDHRPFYPTNRARKFYHHKTGATELTGPHAGIHADQIRTVRALRAGAQFRFVVDFENLREEGLALLLYCLVLEEQVSVTLSPEALSPDHHEPLTLTGPMRHKLGYAKSQGAGSVHLKIERFILRTSPADRYRGLAASGLDLTGEPQDEEVRRRVRHIAERQDPTMTHLRAMMIYAPGDPRAANLNYPTYGWFQEDKRHPPPKPLKPVL